MGKVSRYKFERETRLHILPIRIFSAALSGIDAQLIEVEVDSSPGLHSFNIVGLPDKSVAESKERIGSAIKNSGFSPPRSRTKKVLINLAPADIRKEGPSYDLPIAIGYLFETGQVKFDPSNKLFTGELSLDGRIKPTSGILAMTILAKKLGFREICVPFSNSREASMVRGIDIIGANNLTQIIGHLNRTNLISPTNSIDLDKIAPEKERSEGAFAAIKGQKYAKRALAVAAAGSHNVFMSGPPGSGKTILAKALIDILPPLTLDEAIEVAKVYSSSGLIDSNHPLSLRRPFRSPHHTTSAVAVIGGGTWPKPGEISLAHRGVLFLDELPEFPRSVMESLRQPLEDGTVTVSRVSGSVKLPAKFMLVAAMNPCPCGNYGDPKANCICLPFSVLKYRKRISGPLLDRIDIQINVPRETITTETQDEEEIQKKIEETREITENIKKAKKIQLARFENTDILSNSEMGYKNVEKLCIIEKKAKNILERAINSRGLSLRAYHKTLKVARTIADLANSETIEEHHISEALAFRLDEGRLTELG